MQRAYQEGGLSLIFQRAKNRFFLTYSAWYFCRDLKEPIPPFYPPLKASLIQDPLDLVIKYMKGKKYLSEEEYRIGQENGHWFLGLFIGEEVKGFCKCGFKNIYFYDSRETLSLAEGVSFIYEYEVDEQLRGKGMGKYLISSVLGLLAEKGWRYVFCHIPPKNTASIRVVEDCGFRKVGFIRFVELIGFKWKSKKVEDLLEQAITK